MTFRYTETPDKIIVLLAEVEIQEDWKELVDLGRLAVSSGKRRFVLDFRGVAYLSSAMIGKLVLFNKMAKHEQLDLRVANMGQDVCELFKITRLDNDTFARGY